MPGMGDHLGEIGAKTLEKTAAESLETVEHDIIPAAQAAADALVIRGTRAITEAAGALCTALGSLPAFIGDELDGFTVTISEIKITVTRRPRPSA
jgi:hypothetical protein